MRKIMAFLVVALILLVGCANSPPAKSTEFQWSIVQSPITGRYYEMALHYGTVNGPFLGMGEVTKAEYDAYVKSQENKR